MNKELAIRSQQYGFIAGIFFFGYFIFEIPSNLMLHKMGARVWIARILVSWGIVAAMTGFVQTAFHLYVARFLLGVAEAGYFPGIMLYLTYWFRQRTTGSDSCLVFDCQSGSQHSRRSSIRHDFGSRALVWSQQLEMVAILEGTPGHSGRCSHLFPAAGKT